MTEDIIYLIKTISDKTGAAADADLRRHGLTFSQLRVLGFLHSQGGSTSQREIQRHLEVSHPTAVGLVSRLEKNGFVRCYTDRADRRNKIVRMEEKAVMLGDELEADRQRSAEQQLKGMSDEEKTELFRLLNVIASNMD